jgi:hypothetical protein
VDAAALLDPDDGPDPAGLDVLDDDAGLGGDLGQRRRTTCGGQDVPGVAVGGRAAAVPGRHGPTVTGQSTQNAERHARPPSS